MSVRPASSGQEARGPVSASLQAGGGVPEVQRGSARVVQSFSAVVANYIQSVQKSIEAKYDLSGHPDNLTKFLIEEQGVPEDASLDTTPRSFIEYLTSPSASAIGPIPPQDLSYPISNYFISSSHNTYLTGNQLSSDSSTEAYKNVLLRGCRCVEIDVWDGESPPSSPQPDSPGSDSKSGLREKLGFFKKSKKTPSEAPKSQGTKEDTIEPWRSNTSERAEPRVLHGYTATKEIPFRDVCKTIRDYAFVASKCPVIVSLEVHTSHEQQEIMVEIMETAWKGLLVDAPTSTDDPENLPLPSPAELMNKILIKVKYSPKPPPEPKPEPKKLEPIDTSSSSSSSSDDEAPAERAAKPKIIQALSKLGIYTKSYHFKDFDAPEAKIPTHIFSLSERALLEVHEQVPHKLFEHNKHFLMRTYPHGLRVTSSNIDPVAHWKKGVQIAALNWQKIDAGTMLNEAMFAYTSGWVLKPRTYLSLPPAEGMQVMPTIKMLRLRVTFFAGQDIPLPLDEDKAKDFNAYVKCEIHVEPPGGKTKEQVKTNRNNDEAEYKERTKTAKAGQSPDLGGEVIQFEGITVDEPTLTFVRFKVIDDNMFRDELAAWACYRLDRLRPGYRFIHLYDANGVLSKGVLFVKVQKWLEDVSGAH
ncbi:PLC-like phosphodiesterase [Lineolata rhizophorae]|uniref:Phosphoinositide phospholipase C n=1 Tax=Lineolata rhizophorae TaxID=578093 RepID=A0A6A6P7Q3_9PEZI|nr:PLC-like phosphodiesterase [Lineolata rhizophorae]